VKIGLHRKQRHAINSVATEILYGGAAGGGKSHLMRAAAISWCLSIPGLQVYLFRRLSGDLEKNHMEGAGSFPALLSGMMKSGQVKPNGSKGTLSFSNGSKIHLCHCQYEKDKIKYQGAEIHVLLVDELTHFTESIYTFLRGRCRLGDLKIPDKYKGMFPRIICGANPGGIGHTWVKRSFVDYAPEMQIRRCHAIEGGMLRQYIPARLEDNPTLTRNDPDYEMRLNGLGNASLVRAMRYGDWDIVAGGAFDDVWRRDRHIIRPFAIPSSWKVDRSFDWGSSHPFSIGWWAESNGEEVSLLDGTIKSYPAGTLFRIAEWYGWNGKPNEGCKMLAKDIAKGIIEREKAGLLSLSKVKPGPADGSIYDDENGMCIARDMSMVRHMGVKGVNWVRADKSAHSRVNGLELCRGMLSAVVTDHMEEPGMLVFSNCQHFIRTIPVMPRSETNPDDIDTKAEDHTWDETRYRVLQAKRSTKTQEM